MSIGSISAVLLNPSRKLAGRPLHVASAQHMEMEVKHALTGVGPDVGNQPPTAFGGSTNLGGNIVQGGQQPGVAGLQFGG